MLRPTPRAAPDGETLAALAAAHAAGAAAASEVSLAFGAFVEHVEGMAARQAEALALDDPRARLAALARGPGPDDLYLAAACDRRADRAWDRFAARFLPWLRGVLERQGARTDEAAELCDETPGVLVEPPASGRARTKLGTWDGRARLSSWLAGITLRRWAARRTSADARASGGTDAAHVADGAMRPAAEPPLAAVLGAEAATRLAAALDAGWARLTDRERLAVVLRHRARLPQARIAALLGVGEPRVSRLLSSAVARLQEAVSGVGPEHALTPRGAAVLSEWLATRDGAPALNHAPSTDPEASRDGRP